MCLCQPLQHLLLSTKLIPRRKGKGFLFRRFWVRSLLKFQCSKVPKNSLTPLSVALIPLFLPMGTVVSFLSLSLSLSLSLFFGLSFILPFSSLLVFPSSHPYATSTPIPYSFLSLLEVATHVGDSMGRQTGAGKTYTMMGTPEDEGLIPRAIRYIFSAIHENKFQQIQYKVSMSFVELYNDNFKNLLSSPKQGKGVCTCV